MYLISFVFYFCSKRPFDFFFKSISKKILCILHANRSHMHLLLYVHHSCMTVQLRQMEFLKFPDWTSKTELKRFGGGCE